MDITADQYEKLGAFYLGREYDLDKGELEDELVMYDSKDLVTHGVVLGMTGSGKTGLCLALLEEAAMDGVPAIVIDPKGDIPNLMLTFPEFQGSDFRPWINEDDARKKEMSPDDFAEKTARMWEKGIGEWGQSPERVRKLKDKVDINVFTPGSKAGIPVSVLSSLNAPPFEILDDAELIGDRIESTVISLLSLVGIDADPIQSEEAILLSSIFKHAWCGADGPMDMSLESIISAIQKPSFDKIGVMDLESFYDSKSRMKLALKFNSLLASPGFQSWLQGPPLDIQRMMYDESGKPRISIFSIAHLNDNERMFFVSLLLNQMLGWMRSQTGTTSLRAMLYMDEIFGYLPPTANPPSKKPLMTILKQGRAFGLGTLLATQNPVDLDYKALSNTGTWWLGRLQTERDKMRVIEGLEGAAVGNAGGFDKAKTERMLAGLGSRVFMMNNVHEDEPVVFHVRWVMSYLRGPLSRGQIRTLMEPKRDAFIGSFASEKAASNPMSMGSAKSSPSSARPIVGDGVVEYFATPNDDDYVPYLLRQATVHFSSSKADVDEAMIVRQITPIGPEGIDWDDLKICTTPLKQLADEPEEKIGFAELPGYAMNADNYKTVEDEFEDWVYRNERLNLYYSSVFKEYSKPSESEGDFRARLSHKAREIRDDMIEPLRQKYAKKIASKTRMMERAEMALDREKTQASTAKWEAGASILGGLLGGLFGGRKRKISTTAAKRAYTQHGDIKIAQQKVDSYREEIEEIERELSREIEEREELYDAATTELEPYALKPYKKDIEVDSVALLWVAGGL